MNFRRLTISTLVAVYVLILVGGVVRSTGSGMGCPDWPRCFGNWVPPTSVEQLPENYKEIYSDFRAKKNQRFAKVLTTFGMKETANELVNNPEVAAEQDFNPTKTMIEYINRLVGVVIGFMIILVFLASLRFWKTDRRLTWVAFATLALVIVQGWMGSFVVSTNLTPWTITVHMFLALVLVALLVYLVNVTSASPPVASSLGFWWLLAAMSMLLVQTLLGTQVRETIDQVASRFPRESWIANASGAFIIHRSFSWIVLLVHAGFIVRLGRTEGLKGFPLILIILILATIFTGVGLAYFAIPAFLQPVHLLLATITFGLQFLMLLKVAGQKKLQAA